LLTLLPHHSQWLSFDLPSFTSFLHLSGNEQIVVFTAAALLVTLSGLVGRGAALPVVRFAEGYWPDRFDRVCDWLIARAERRTAAEKHRLNELRESFDSLTPRELREYAKLDELLEISTPKHDPLPTKLGNVLRAAENQPADRYGLNTLVCWPRLWLVLPESTKQELTGTRNGLDRAAIIAFWGGVGLVWTAWTWLAIPIALITVHFAYASMLRAAATYGDLLVAAFDVHRRSLYNGLRWPLPSDPASELATGHEITQYLWRGSSKSVPQFTSAQTEDAASTAD
jgi:hypothetical protein